MNNSEKNLLAETDPMSESHLVRLDDWQLAHLRVAMLRQVEETLSEVMAKREVESATRGRRIKPRTRRDESALVTV